MAETTEPESTPPAAEDAPEEPEPVTETPTEDAAHTPIVVEPEKDPEPEPPVAATPSEPPAPPPSTPAQEYPPQLVSQAETLTLTTEEGKPVEVIVIGPLENGLAVVETAKEPTPVEEPPAPAQEQEHPEETDEAPKEEAEAITERDEAAILAPYRALEAATQNTPKPGEEADNKSQSSSSSASSASTAKAPEPKQEEDPAGIAIIVSEPEQIKDDADEPTQDEPPKSSTSSSSSDSLKKQAIAPPEELDPEAPLPKPAKGTKKAKIRAKVPTFVYVFLLGHDVSPVAIELIKKAAAGSA